MARLFTGAILALALAITTAADTSAAPTEQACSYGYGYTLCTSYAPSYGYSYVPSYSTGYGYEYVTPAYSQWPVSDNLHGATQGATWRYNASRCGAWWHYC
jgi:hypothetical protein